MGFGILRKVGYDFHFSVESNWIGITSLHYCPIGLKKLAPLSHSIGINTKTSDAFSALWVSHYCKPMTSSFDWFNVLSVSLICNWLERLL